MHFVPKAVFALVVAAGVGAAGLAANAQPAQAATFVSAGIGISLGGGYAPPPRYHWYSWRDAGGWHRRWVAYGWRPPVAYARPVYFRPAPVVYAHPVSWYHDDGRRDRDWHRDHDLHHDHDWR